MVVIGFIVAVVINALTELDIGSKINSMKSGRLGGHIVLCGYSGLGERIVDQLREKGKRFVVIEKNPTKLEELGERGYTALEGDFTDINTLRKAGAEQGRLGSILRGQRLHQPDGDTRRAGSSTGSSS